MLYFILIWTLLLVGCSGCGLGLLNLLKIRSIDRAGDRAIVAVWLVDFSRYLLEREIA